MLPQWLVYTFAMVDRLDWQKKDESAFGLYPMMDIPKFEKSKLSLLPGCKNLGELRWLRKLPLKLSILVTFCSYSSLFIRFGSTAPRCYKLVMLHCVGYLMFC